MKVDRKSCASLDRASSPSAKANRLHPRSHGRDLERLSWPLVDTHCSSHSKSRSSSRRGKAYEDYSKRDLEKEASENYNEPLGNYVKDSRVQQHEGNEESVRTSAGAQPSIAC